MARDTSTLMLGQYFKRRRELVSLNRRKKGGKTEKNGFIKDKLALNVGYML